jgi:EmrB/QacA subfamily drug resistance transporter
MQYKWVALTVTAVGTLMAGVDTRIVIVGLPTIARQLGAGVEDVIWVSQAYVFASTVGLLLIGRVTDVIGRVKIYNVGFAVFTVGSALASLSFSPYELIASRMVQGVGSSMLITNSAAILTDATPRNELGTILGINQIAFRVGSVAGLTLSGVILAFADWRALFYINIPIGIFGTVWAHRRLREIATKDMARKMDWPGFVTFTSGLTLILLSITFFSYGLTSDFILGTAFLFLGVLLMIAFVEIERRRESPLLDLRLFKIRLFAAGNLAQFFNALAWTGVILMLSFFLQVVLGYSALEAGLSLLPLDATFVVFGPISGRLSDLYGSRLFSTVGLVVSSAGFFLLSTVTTSTGYWEIAAVLSLLGVGNGLFVSPNISAIMGSVPANRRGIASGFRTTIFNVGLTASAGLAVLLMTFAIPYGTFSSLVEGIIPQLGAGLIAKQEFVNGFRLAAFVFASLNTAAIFPSALRGESATKGERVHAGESNEQTAEGQRNDEALSD